MFIPRFIVADDVLCPNKDEQGNKSCGWYKRECEYTLNGYQNSLAKKYIFENTILRDQVAYPFGRMQNKLSSIERQFKDDQDIRNNADPELSDLTTDEKKDRLEDDRRNTYVNYCRDFFDDPGYIYCMENALQFATSFSWENDDPEVENQKKRLQQNLSSFSNACNRCNNDLKCANEKFHDIQLEILGVNLTEDETSTEDEDTTEQEEETEKWEITSEDSKNNQEKKEEIWSPTPWWAETSESSSEKPEKPSCEGIKLNTNIPFIGNCIPTGSQSEVFPIFIGGLIKFMMSLLLLIGFICILIGGIMITMGKVTEWKNLIMKVIRALAAIGWSGVILKIINPNFFS